MWQHFVSVPLVARIIGLAGLSGLALYAWLKRKVLTTFAGFLTDSASEKFWGYLRRKLQTGVKSLPQTPSNEKTYRGKFQGYAQYANYPHEFSFQIEHDGETTKVPVMKTNLLSGIQHGEFVEIDTRVGVNLYAEVVQRVRVGRTDA